MFITRIVIVLILFYFTFVSPVMLMKDVKSKRSKTEFIKGATRKNRKSPFIWNNIHIIKEIYENIINLKNRTPLL